MGKRLTDNTPVTFAAYCQRCDELIAEGMTEDEAEEVALNEMHFRDIDLTDPINQAILSGMGDVALNAIVEMAKDKVR